MDPLFWFCLGTYLPKIWVSSPPPPDSKPNTDLSPTHTISRTAEFMAKLRFFQYTYLLSFQKASLAINLCFNLFFGIPPLDRFVPSQVTLSTWNIVLGEADKINLRRKFNQSQYEFHR